MFLTDVQIIIYKIKTIEFNNRLFLLQSHDATVLFSRYKLILGGNIMVFLFTVLATISTTILYSCFMMASNIDNNCETINNDKQNQNG